MNVSRAISLSYRMRRLDCETLVAALVNARQVMALQE
jgi:hypothetical protein